MRNTPKFFATIDATDRTMRVDQDLIVSRATRLLDLLDRRREQLCLLVCLLMGLVTVIANSFNMNPDGVSYLDISDAWVRLDWKHGFNPYWSSLFPMLLGLTRRLVPVSPSREHLLVHLVNYAIYACSLGFFQLFMRQVAAIRAEEDARDQYPAWMLQLSGYLIFLLTSLTMTMIVRVNPDLLVNCAVYAAAWLTLKLRQKRQRWAEAAALGIALGLGYWAKAAMFFVGLVWLAVVTWWPGEIRLRMSRMLAAWLAFACLCLPLIGIQSHMTHHFSVGETGPLNYAWFVNQTTRFVYWHGEGVDAGRPLHPPRQILHQPDIFEFASPVPGTYPVWDNPYYWYEGYKTHFDFRQQWDAVIANLRAFQSIFHSGIARMTFSLFLGWTLLYAGRWKLSETRSLWVVLLPCLAAIGMYSLVLVLPRYVASFTAISLIVLLCGSCMKPGRSFERLRGRVVIAVMAVVLCIMHHDLRHCYINLIHPDRNPLLYREARIVAALEGAGVPEGAPVADMIRGIGMAYWARQGRYRVIAELKHQAEEATPTYLIAGDRWPAAREAFRQTGARVIVAETGDLPPEILHAEWHPIPQTSNWYYLFPPPTALHASATAGPGGH